MGRRVSCWVLTGFVALSFVFVAWASTCGNYSGGTDVWGITEISGDFEVFCNSDKLCLNVKGLPSVTWSDTGIETDAIVVRTPCNGTVITDFILPDVWRTFHPEFSGDINSTILSTTDNDLTTSVELSWDFGEGNICNGIITCYRDPGTKRVRFEALKLSRTTRVRIYAGPEGEVLGDEDFVCETSDLGETIDLSECLDAIVLSHGDEANVIIGLANWGPENIRLVNDCQGIRYVTERGEGFMPLVVPDHDGKTVFPGSMGIVQITREELEAGSGTFDLSQLVQTAEGESGGCSAQSGLHFMVLLGLPFLAVMLRKR